MNLCDELTIRMLLERHGFHFSKSMGQNFLIDPQIPADIAAASQADETCGVLEIGPGIGPLTSELAQRAGKVVSIELDRALLPILAETMAEHPNVEIVPGDVMKLDLNALIAEKFQVLRPIVCANLGGWGERNVSIQLSGLLDGIKVLVGNDADVAALGEIWMGCAKGCRSAVMVTLGTGVGGGVIVNGRIIEGAHGAGGEIGHITVNPHETAVCGCGKHGCLEQYSSATGVVRCMKKLLDENPDTPCTLRGTDFAAKDVFDAARAGDALAAREVDEMTDTLGMALASIASTTDPEMFMVGGGVARAGDVLFNPLREHFKTYAFSSCRETPIVAATLGNDAGIYGAVRLIVGE